MDKFITVKNASESPIAHLLNTDIIECSIKTEQGTEATLTFSMRADNPKYSQIANDGKYFYIDNMCFIFPTDDNAVSEEHDSNNKKIVTFELIERFKELSKKYITCYNNNTATIDTHVVSLVSGGNQGAEIINSDGSISYVGSSFQKGSAGYALSIILVESGWGIDIVDVDGTFDLETEQKTIRENIDEIVNLWGGILVIDSANKFVSLRSGELYKPGNGFRLDTSVKGIRSIKRTISRNIYTRAYVYGKDGLNIKSVNNGKEFIDNNVYTSDVFETILINNAIDNSTQLYNWGSIELAKIAKPRAQFDIDFDDIKALNGTQSFKLNDIVTVKDEALAIDYSMRVVSKEYNPFKPYSCKASFGDVLEKLEDKLAGAIIKSGTVSDWFTNTGKLSSNNVSMANQNQTLTNAATGYANSFSTIGVAGYARSGNTEITASGLTVYNGAITIKNMYGENVFYADPNGNLIIKGTINATAGTIGPWQVGSDGLYSEASSGNNTSISPAILNLSMPSGEYTQITAVSIKSGSSWGGEIFSLSRINEQAYLTVSGTVRIYGELLLNGVPVATA